MSLTSALRYSGSPIYKFFKQRSPNTRSSLADARKRVKASDVIRQNEKVPWSTIGTALDYRI